MQTKVFAFPDQKLRQIQPRLRADEVRGCWVTSFMQACVLRCRKVCSSAGDKITALLTCATWFYVTARAQNLPSIARAFPNRGASFAWIRVRVCRPIGHPISRPISRPLSRLMGSQQTSEPVLIMPLDHAANNFLDSRTTSSADGNIWTDR
jgi:hypothetical protein